MTMRRCQTCGSLCDGTAILDGASDHRVMISGEDFEFMLRSFDTLMSPYASTTELLASIKAENEIWALLRAIKNSQREKE